ncbi:MAG: hypothetical protein GXO21_07265 [Aquificae bacterium]|nr:hypothetical protein [Aquificota bacterium]
MKDFRVIFLSFLLFADAFAETIVVDNTQALQEALKDERYDVILLRPGKYIGNFILNRGDVTIKKEEGAIEKVELIQKDLNTPLFSVKPTGLNAYRPKFRLSGITVKELDFICDRNDVGYCLDIENVKKFNFINNAINAIKGCYISGSEVQLKGNIFKVKSEAIRFVEGETHRILDTTLINNVFVDESKTSSDDCFISFKGSKTLQSSKIDFVNNQFKASSFRNQAVCLYDYNKYNFYFEGNELKNIYYFVVMPAREESVSLTFSSNILSEESTRLQIFNFEVGRAKNIRVIYKNVDLSKEPKLIYFYNAKHKGAKSFEEEIEYYLSNLIKLKERLAELGIKVRVYDSYKDYLTSINTYRSKISQIITYQGINESNVDEFLSLVVNLAFVPLYREESPLVPSLDRFEKYIYFETFHKLLDSEDSLSFYSPIYKQLINNFYVNGKKYIDFVPPAPRDSGAACHLFADNINIYSEWIRNYKYALTTLKNVMQSKSIVGNKQLLRKVVEVNLLLQNHKKDLAGAYKIFLFDFPLGIILLNYKADLVKLEKEKESEIYGNSVFRDLAYSFAPFGWIKNKLVVSNRVSDYFQDLTDEFKRLICYKDGKYLCDEKCEKEECNKRKSIWKEFENRMSTKPPCWIEGIEEFVK